MGKKKHDVAPPETEASQEAAAAADRPEISAAAPQISGAAVPLQPAGGQLAGEPAQPDDGARAGEDGNDVLVADAILKGQGDGEAAAQVSENQQDPAAQGTGDPDAAADAGVAGLGTAVGNAASYSHGVAGAVSDTADPDLGDGSAAGEQEADDIIKNWLLGAFDDLAGRQHVALADIVYRDRAFPISGLASSAAALLPYYLPGTKTGPIFSHQEAETMAAFVRANPEAPLLAMWKQVEIKHKLPATIPNNADMLALTVFHAVCQAVIAYEKAEAADQAEREAREIPTATWHGEQSFQVQASGFEATGFTPR